MQSSIRALGIPDRITAGLFDPDGILTDTPELSRALRCHAWQQSSDELQERDVEHLHRFTGRMQGAR